MTKVTIAGGCPAVLCRGDLIRDMGEFETRPYVTLSDDASHATASTSPARHAYKSASWKYPHGPTTSAPRASPRRDSAGASQRRGAEYEERAIYSVRPAWREIGRA